jgi:hypothetical protein
LFFGKRNKWGNSCKMCVKMLKIIYVFFICRSKGKEVRCTKTWWWPSSTRLLQNSQKTEDFPAAYCLHKSGTF